MGTHSKNPSDILKYSPFSTVSAQLPPIGPGSAGQINQSINTTTVVHGLGYTPSPVGFKDENNLRDGYETFTPLNITQTTVMNSTCFFIDEIRISANNINIYITCTRTLFGATPSGNPVNTPAFNVKYYLLQQVAR